MMENWNSVKLGDVCIIERGASPRPIDKYITTSEDGVNWIKIGDTDDTMYITSTTQKITIDGMKKSRYVQVGDFILSNSMSFGRPYILKIDGCIHDGWLLLRDTENVFDKKFLYYYLSSPSTYSKFKLLAVGGVVNNLNSQMVRELAVPLPPLEEQRKIAETLDKVSDLIAKRKQQLEKLDLLVKSKFVEMFGDPILNNKDWTIRKVIEECDCMVPGRDKPKTFTGNIPWITIDDLCLNSITYKSKQNLGLTQKEIDDVNRKAIPKDSVIMSCVGNLGICSIAGTDMVINQQLHSFQCHSSLNNIYLMYYLGQRKDYMNQQATSTTVLYMNKSVCNSIPTMVPPIELQNQFADFVKQTEKTKTIINQSLEKLEILKKALMQEYFG